MSLSKPQVAPLLSLHLGNIVSGLFYPGEEGSSGFGKTLGKTQWYGYGSEPIPLPKPCTIPTFLYRALPSRGQILASLELMNTAGLTLMTP